MAVASFPLIDTSSMLGLVPVPLEFPTAVARPPVLLPDPGLRSSVVSSLAVWSRHQSVMPAIRNPLRDQKARWRDQCADAWRYWAPTNGAFNGSVHPIWHSLIFCGWKDRKAVAADLRPIYQAPTAEWKR